jgi:hypothetical protein
VLTVLGLAALIIFLVRRTRRDAERWDEEIGVGGTT